MLMQTVNEDAEEGGTQLAARSEADGWTLAGATLTTNIDSREPSSRDWTAPACGHVP